MEKKYHKTAGVIPGKPKDLKILNEYMQSTINTIKKEISNKFSKEKKNINIYYKYYEEKRIFSIYFIILNNNPKYKTKDITYLITIDEEYPQKAPNVYCLSDFHEKLDIFDMKNIQKNLIEQWKQKNTVSDLLSELIIFSKALAFQADNMLLPNIGEYHYNSYIYNLNDFLLNKNNIFFRVYYFSSHEKNNDINKNERFMIITKNFILFLAIKNPNRKNLCILEFKFELTWIEDIKKYFVSKYPNYTFFEFLWNNHSNYLHKFVFGTKGNQPTINKINELIMERKKYLINNFKYFEKFSDNDVETLEKIINIKEKFLDITFSKTLYYQIHKLYRNIINIFNSMNDEGYKNYVNKLQKFITKFEKVKK